MSDPLEQELRKKFLEYFNEVEGFHLRSERFYDDLEAARSADGIQPAAEYMIKWLEAAFMVGAHTVLQELNK